MAKEKKIEAEIIEKTDAANEEKVEKRVVSKRKINPSYVALTAALMVLSGVIGLVVGLNISKTGRQNMPAGIEHGGQMPNFENGQMGEMPQNGSRRRNRNSTKENSTDSTQNSTESAN